MHISTIAQILFKSIQFLFSAVMKKSNRGPRHTTWGNTFSSKKPSLVIRTLGTSNNSREFSVAGLAVPDDRLNKVIALPQMPVVIISVHFSCF